MTTTAESDARVQAHARALIQSGISREDALVHAAGKEAASGKLDGVKRVRLATADMGGPGVSDAQIIAMGEAASREANRGIPFHVKIARCANQLADHEFEEMQKAIRTMETTLKELEAEVAARGSSQYEHPRLIGPSQAKHIDGRHLDHYWDFRDRLAGDLRAKKVRPTAEAIIRHATEAYGLDVSDAAEWTERFLDSISRDLERRAAIDTHPAQC
jgi:hypothetical protein